MGCEIINFEPPGGYLQVDQAILTAMPFSFSLWFWPADFTYQAALMGFSDIDTSSRYCEIGFRGDLANDPVEALMRGAAAVQARTTVGPTPSAWNQIVAVFAGTASRSIYLNGGNKVTNTNSALSWPAPDRTTLGARGGFGGPFFSSYQCGLAEAAIYGVALSDADVTKLFTHSPRLVRRADLIAHWPLRKNLNAAVGGVNMSARDASGAPGGNGYLPFGHPAIVQPPGQLEVSLANEGALVEPGTILI